MAIIDERGAGPQFGPEGLKVRRGIVADLHCASAQADLPHSPALVQVSIESRAARSRLGTYYERRRDGSRTLFTADEAGSATITALRAWVGVGVAPGTDGYKPSMLQCAPGLRRCAAGPLHFGSSDRCAEALRLLLLLR
jgi:hypothetical protein